ncbi:hypothetical protein, partial [Neorhizobium galegae]|uniref:hypothetical protein n=1 Tax=Neorhizobium galegae TaxID=399 RepID=UPI0021058026
KSPMWITPLPPSLSALGEGSHGSILNGNYAPNRLSSAWKPTLYAPSDFVDETNFVKASGAFLDAKTYREAIEVSQEVAAEVIQEGHDTPSDEVEQPPLAEQVQKGDGDSPVPKDNAEDSYTLEHRHSGTLSRAAQRTASEVRRGREAVWSIAQELRLTEELAIEAISRSTGLPFERNVSPQGAPEIVFDAVYQTDEEVTVIEVKYNRSGGLPKNGYQDSLHMAFAYYAKLPKAKQRIFSFILAVVFEEGISQVNKDLFRRAFHIKLADYPFPITLRTFEKAELQATLFER